MGGLHPDLPFSYFTDMMRGIKQVRPDIHVKAFTAVEIFFFHRLYRMSVEQVLAELKEAGPRLDAGRAGRRSSRRRRATGSSRARPTPRSGST